MKKKRLLFKLLALLSVDITGFHQGGDKVRDIGGGGETGSQFQYQNGYWDLLFGYSICPTQPIFTNTESAMLSKIVGRCWNMSKAPSFQAIFF